MPGSTASPGAPTVAIANAAFATPHVDVLAGDTVTWHNESVRVHDVDADDGSFLSPRLAMDGTFGRRFDAVGTYAYHCSLHPSMRGSVGVYRVLLSAPRDAAAPGRPLVLSGRAALPAGAAVSIVDDADAVAATAVVDGSGAFSATVRPTASGSFRAVADGDGDGGGGPPVQVLVLDRSVRASAAVVRGGRVRVTALVTPSSPGATVVLQLRLKEHFGWWPVRTTRVGADSRARFVLPRQGHRVAARVLLTAADGATELARSSTFHVR
ncbi:MAG TPA: plastocyanin/azurin family copper-binding protein [Solirubrobacter sp.]|nr:plastocyanin/azurin family copper-binding protein [Solirubrobacter sp.]